MTDEIQEDQRAQAAAFPVGEALPEATLIAARSLPTKPAPVTLTGARVVLRPLDLAQDIEPLYAASNGAAFTVGTHHTAPYDAELLVWRYLARGPFADAAGLAAHLREQVEAADDLCFAVVDRATDVPVGVVNYMNNMPAHLKVELGNIWYSPAAQRTGANTEATYLLLDHAFSLGYRRVEWKCDSLNTRSRHAAERMGFRFEGIQEQHFIIKGRNRDTAWFRILAREWPEVKRHLRESNEQRVTRPL